MMSTAQILVRFCERCHFSASQHALLSSMSSLLRLRSAGPLDPRVWRESGAPASCCARISREVPGRGGGSSPSFFAAAAGGNRRGLKNGSEFLTNLDRLFHCFFQAAF